MENPFYSVMNAYSDEELLAVYKDRFNYEPEAVEAMEIVIWERDLQDEVAAIAGEQAREDAESKDNIDAKFQNTEFGKVISDAEYAQECLTDSFYFKRFVSPMHGFNVLNNFAIVLGLSGAIIAGILIGVENFSSRYSTLLVISIIAAFLFPFGIWRLSRNKSLLTIEKRTDGNFIVISGPKGQHEMKLPVRYECYWKWNDLGRGVKQRKLYMFLYDDKNKTLVVLNEIQPTLKSPSPYWDEFRDNVVPYEESAFEYSNHGFQKPFLYQFEKILSGLSDGSDK